MAASRRNSALKIYMTGRRAEELHGLTNLAGNWLSAFDLAVTRSMAGLQRRAAPAASRNVRAEYNVRAGTLRDAFRVETGLRGRRNDQDDYLSIWASTRQIPLMEFGGRWRGPARRRSGAWAPAASAEIVRGQRKVYDSAFIATIRGRRAIRVRQFHSAGGRRPGRGPVRMLRGPSPFEMLSGVGGYEASMNARERTVTELTTWYAGELRRQFRLQRQRS